MLACEVAAAVLALAVLASGCSGSASETPWPAPPEGIDLGPAGEAQTEVPRSAPSSTPTSAPTSPSPAPTALP